MWSHKQCIFVIISSSSSLHIRCANIKIMPSITLFQSLLLLANVSSAVPHPDVFWYGLNGLGAQKNAPKKVLVALFPYIFHVKPKWNIVYEYLKTKIFSRDSNIFPQMHWISNIFGHSAKIIGGFFCSTKLSNP